jgi:hypothetical protein
VFTSDHFSLKLYVLKKLSLFTSCSGRNLKTDGLVLVGSHDSQYSVAIRAERITPAFQGFVVIIYLPEYLYPAYRELSEEEYEADKKVRQAQKEFAACGNKLPNSVSSEIDDLIERASSGQLRAISPDKNEHPNKEWDGTVDNEDDLFV